MTRRRPRLRLRKPRGTGEHIAAGVVALAAANLLLQMVRAARDAVVRGWPLLLVLAASGLAYGLWRVLRAARARQTRAEKLALLRITLADIDAMDDQAFEFALRDLLIRDGWSARKVGRKGDQAADVIGDHPQRGRIVVQAKHTRVGGKVGASVMYAVKGTAGPVHKADHAVVVTNGAFTRDAMTWGDRHGVHWVDREKLQRWAESGAALHELLGVSARSRPNRFKRAA
ncbi:MULTISPECIES: restriction endonuclease [Streptomyces]|uniref:restriction endonuclease n=1 Tax=Streptomyces TaxID=1883 RepID=UPI001B328B32|nr:restriction endonuclease [Streptomyces sp. AgN23]QTI90599.1 restriction endonuclease [Streptomyces sp. AgN23]WTA78578.1 restriction endonuclease [Streptomyces antimycoticus]WTA86822.1 restriction endonuclease [Streptomyces antimycoticus]